jgi:hypothetical protein
MKSDESSPNSTRELAKYITDKWDYRSDQTKVALNQPMVIVFPIAYKINTIKQEQDFFVHEGFILEGKAVQIIGDGAPYVVTVLREHR